MIDKRAVWALALFSLLAILLAVRVLGDAAPARPIIAYSQFKQLAEAGRIKSVALKGQEITGVLKSAEPLVEGTSAVTGFRSYQPQSGRSWPVALV